MRIDDVLRGRSAALLREFEEKHMLQDVVEITSTKASHVLVGVYETQDGRWMARLQPAHLYDARFRAGTYSLSIDQLDKLIDALMQVRDVLSDKPTRQVVQRKRVPARQAAATTQAQAPAPTQDPVLAAIERLAHGLETVMRRLDTLESAMPAEQQVNEQEEIQQSIEWQIQHTQAPYDCPICGKAYKSKGRYLTHVAKEHGIEI